MTLTFESFLTGFFAVMSAVILLGWTFGRQKALSIFKKEKTRKEKEKERVEKEIEQYIKDEETREKKEMEDFEKIDGKEDGSKAFWMEFYTILDDKEREFKSKGEKFENYMITGFFESFLKEKKEQAQGRLDNVLCFMSHRADKQKEKRK